MNCQPSGSGSNNYGELGNGTTSSSATPTPIAVIGLGNGLTAVGGRTGNSFAIQNGALWAWGYN